MDNKYKLKYLKYKDKYLKFKQKFFGGETKPVEDENIIDTVENNETELINIEIKHLNGTIQRFSDINSSLSVKDFIKNYLPESRKSENIYSLLYNTKDEREIIKLDKEQTLLSQVNNKEEIKIFQLLKGPKIITNDEKLNDLFLKLKSINDILKKEYIEFQSDFNSLIEQINETNTFLLNNNDYFVIKLRGLNCPNPADNEDGKCINSKEFISININDIYDDDIPDGNKTDNDILMSFCTGYWITNNIICRDFIDFLPFYEKFSLLLSNLWRILQGVYMSLDFYINKLIENINNKTRPSYLLEIVHDDKTYMNNNDEINKDPYYRGRGEINYVPIEKNSKNGNEKNTRLLLIRGYTVNQDNNINTLPDTGYYERALGNVFKYTTTTLESIGEGEEEGED